MPLRFSTLVYTFINCIFLRKFLLLLLLSISYSNLYSQGNTDDLKKEADKLFEEDEFTSAYKLYAQLVANFPKDPEYNFRLGVCMIYSEPDKKKCLPFLQFANSRTADAPKETKFYLGKAYHINYLFDEAIKFYNDYKKIGTSAKQKKLQVDREIRACGYGKRLLSNMSDLEVISKKTLNESDYFRSYDLKNIGGKLLAKPDEFQTSPDKRKKDKSIVYLPKIGERVYYSSYGSNNDNGRDIYYRIKLPNGKFSPGVKVNGINTEFDEDYPFLHPNGTTLYFASKGHNSMGGYDIFKSTYLAATDSWSQPENLEFPINSPDDDYLYVTDSLEKTAYFSTGRQSLPGKIDVLKINTQRKPIDVLAIKGTVVKESSEQSLKSVITVKNMSNGINIGTFEAQDNGDYLMDLPNGSKLLFTVETPGMKTQSDRVLLPLLASSKPLRQTIAYEKGVLKIINYFDEATSDESYIQYLKLIEQKAKLNVNAGENKLGGPEIVTNDTTKNAAGNTKYTGNGPSVTEDTTGTKAVVTNTPSTKQSLTKQQLADIAKQDEDDARKEAQRLKQDEWDAVEVGTAKKIEADKKWADADEAYKNAEAITDEGEKKIAMDKAIAIKTEAETERNTANKILDLAKTLGEDAANKQKIADLNSQYVKELDNVIKNKNNNDGTAKLDDIQKQITELSSKKNQSDNSFSSIKNEVDEKEKEIAKLEKSNDDTKANLGEIKTAISTNETDLANAKKKQKPIIQEKINELKGEQIEKEKQIAANETEIKKLQDELAGLKNELDLKNKIKNETIAVNTNTSGINTNTTGTNSGGNEIKNNGSNINGAGEKITDQVLSDKYKDKVVVTDSNNKANIEESIAQLKNYNKEIDKALAKDKTDLLKAKTPIAKQELNTEIKKLETTKKQNQQQITANNKLVGEITKSIAGNNSGQKNAGTNLSPITSNSKEDAFKQLNGLNEQLNTNDNSNFEYNGYQNSQAQSLKVEADAKINEAAAQQKKLKDLITTSKEQIQNASAASTNTGQTNGVKTPNEINKEADDIMAKALEYRNEAKTKEGGEKEALITKAKEEENKANEKHLQAAEVLKDDNRSLFDTNNENIETLKKEGKASELDLSEVNKLQDAANTAFKQAVNMRQEANSLPNIGAKLGNLGNAEEKETEALDKQKQALYILQKTNPNAVLKTAVTSAGGTNPAANTGTLDLAPQLESVNTGLNDLANLKLNAYQKLYDANKAELDALVSNLRSNQTIIDKMPSLKSEFIAGNNKITKSETQKQTSDAATNNNNKLNDLINATKIQVEAINQLTALEKKLNQAIVKNNTANNNTGNNGNNTGNNGNETANTNTTTANTNTTAANSNTETANTNTVAVNTNTGSPNTNTTAVNSNTESANTNTTAANTNTTAVNSNTETANTNTTAANTETNNANNTESIASKTVDVAELAKKDTSVTQVVNYFENNKAVLKNQGANQLVNNSLTELKKVDEQNKAVDAEIKNAEGTNTNSSETPFQLKTKAESLLVEAEDLGVKSFDLKKTANEKSGPEKDSLLTKAKELDDQAVNKKLEAVKLTDQSNEMNYNTNNTAIVELLGKAKNDNPTLASQLEPKYNDIAILKNQAKQMREEANTQTNSNAKIGALMNAEEKENDILQKQNEVLAELKKQYPDYVVKEPSANSGTVPEELKQKQAQLREKQFSELTNLTNAFSLEYETSKNNVPENLTEAQKTVKQNAEDLNKESKRLLVASAFEKNENERVKLLTLSAKAGNAAVDQLNKIVKPSNTVANNPRNNNPTNNNPRNNNPRNNNANNNPRNNANANNNPANNNVANNNPRNNNINNNPRNNVIANNPENNNTPRNTGRGTVKVEGLEVIVGNAYSAAKPIPIDAKIEDGLVFRVQIGAFKTPLPNNTFRGLNPVNAETAGNGYIRYTAGNFNKIENANAVKNDLRGLGYADAFVVVFFNGKRITYAEALDLLAKEGKTVDENASKTAGITANVNIPKVNNPPANNNVATNNVPNNTVNANTNVPDEVKVVKNLTEINDLLFTVQIGLYSRPVKQRQLFNLSPIYSEKLPNGLIRYTAGIYKNTDRMVTDKNKVVSLGIRDAFTSAYLNGKRITFDEGKIKQQDTTTKMEPENPIVFPEGNNSVNNTPVNNTPVNNTPVNNNTPAVTPFTNGVTKYPDATPENGIKTSPEGVCFKVQIGAYSRQVPNDVAAKFSTIKTWPVENVKINTLYIYNIGNYTGAKFAKALKDEAVRAGINDAFITVYKDGVKLFGAEAVALMNQ